MVIIYFENNSSFAIEVPFSISYTLCMYHHCLLNHNEVNNNESFLFNGYKNIKVSSGACGALLLVYIVTPSKVKIVSTINIQ